MASNPSLEAGARSQYAPILFQTFLQAPGRGENETKVRRRRMCRPALKLGVELAPHEEWVTPYLRDHHPLATLVLACEAETPRFHGGDASHVDLVAMPVALVYHRLAAVQFVSKGVRVLDDCGAGAEAHRAAHNPSGSLGHKHHDWMRGGLLELHGIGVLPTKLGAREFNHGRLQSNADAQVWHLARPTIGGCEDLALDAPVTEASRHKHTMGVL
mmetsp:Transcript_20188/g.55928  ORF Transcript_20188/g.55928 Transcript_20188/m.55928 type:complete len:215 (-) Transcript_20188:1316-1960(-)